MNSSNEFVMENPVVEVVTEVKIDSFIKSLESDLVFENLKAEGSDKLIKFMSKKITDLMRVSGMWAKSSLSDHLKNLKQMVKNIYSEMLMDKESLQKELYNLLISVDFALNHNASQKTIRDAGASVFHFMNKLIVEGKDYYVNSGCKCMIDGCEEKAINSHSISRSHNFKRGINYYSIKARIRDEKKANLGVHIGRVTSSSASTRPMFCAKHDHDLFKPIEGESNLDVKNPEHLFLQNWRTFLWENHSTKDYVQNLRHELEKNPQLLNQRTLQIESNQNSIDSELFENNSRDIVYFALTFTNKPPIIASFCGDMSLLLSENKNPMLEGKQKFFFHLLNNNNNHCLVISGFRSRTMVKALKGLKEIYEKDNYLFWQQVFNLMPLNKNVYVNESFAMNSTLADKMKKIYLNSHQNKGVSFMNPAPISFSKKELFSFFGMSKLQTNIE